MTHNFSPTMLEWLVDILKESNQKRWGQAVDTMYVNIQNHILMHLLPALDRLSTATTSLRGNAKFYEGSTRFNVAPDIFSRVLDGIDSLRLVARGPMGRRRWVRERSLNQPRSVMAFDTRIPRPPRPNDPAQQPGPPERQ